ncbi:MAG TPA: type VI secretion system baseplate subunit TssG [Myxococcaceae bacterium]|nr:type VI secretion system baseplate subunit TssG [Myxococcaceae bacterium]
MDTADGQPAAPVSEPPGVEALLALRLGFVPLVRLLERLTPDAVRVGGEGPLSDERIRFRHDRALQFHASDVVALERDDGGASARYCITSGFLGLSGSMSPLPAYMAEEVVHEDDDEPLRREFLDLFHHRLLSLFFRAVVRYQPSTEHTRELDDAWSTRALALLGIDAGPERFGRALSRGDLLRLAPLLVRRSRGPRELEAALRSVLGPRLGEATIRVEECSGRWTEVDPENWTRLGSRCTVLGQDLLVGHRVYDRAGSFTVAVGPTTWAVLEQFRAGGELLALTRELVAWLVRDPLDWLIAVTLLPRETPGLQLSARGTSRLGRSSWLRSRSEQTVLVVDPLHPERTAAA